jgi:hypothetical protein
MTGAAARGYRVDFVPLHWYGGDFRADAWFSLATPDEGGDGTGLYRPDGTRTPAGDAYRAAT